MFARNMGIRKMYPDPKMDFSRGTLFNRVGKAVILHRLLHLFIL